MTNNLDFERTLLATMMLSPADCWRITISPDHFASEQHAEILRTVQARAAASEPIDPVSVADAFEQQGKRALSRLTLQVANCVTTATPEAYAARIVAGWRSRKASDIGAQLVGASVSVDDAVAGLMALHFTEQKHEFTAKEVCRDAFADLQTAHEAKGGLLGVPTGIMDLDDKLGGLHAGDLIIVAGRAAMGKTSFMANVAKHAASKGIPIGIISGEQPAKQLGSRMVSAVARVPAKSFRTARFDEAEWSRVYSGFHTVAPLPMYFYDRSSPTMAEVVRVTRRWIAKHGIKALYVDYLQRITGEGDRRYEQVSNVARGLKNLARDTNIPVVALAQVSRDAERDDRTPSLRHLSDSSEIEKEADQVMILYRPGYYDESANQHEAIVDVAKNRHGATGKVKVYWSADTMEFHDLARDGLAA